MSTGQSNNFRLHYALATGKQNKQGAVPKGAVSGQKVHPK